MADDERADEDGFTSIYGTEEYLNPGMYQRAVMRKFEKSESRLDIIERVELRIHVESIFHCLSWMCPIKESNFLFVGGYLPSLCYGYRQDRMLKLDQLNNEIKYEPEEETFTSIFGAEEYINPCMYQGKTSKKAESRQTRYGDKVDVLTLGLTMLHCMFRPLIPWVCESEQISTMLFLGSQAVRRAVGVANRRNGINRKKIYFDLDYGELHKDSHHNKRTTVYELGRIYLGLMMGGLHQIATQLVMIKSFILKVDISNWLTMAKKSFLCLVRACAWMPGLVELIIFILGIPILGGIFFKISQTSMTTGTNYLFGNESVSLGKQHISLKDISGGQTFQNSPSYLGKGVRLKAEDLAVLYGETASVKRQAFFSANNEGDPDGSDEGKAFTTGPKILNACVICKRCRSNILFIPCLHHIICDTCWENEVIQQCPSCNEIILTTRRTIPV